MFSLAGPLVLLLAQWYGMEPQIHWFHDLSLLSGAPSQVAQPSRRSPLKGPLSLHLGILFYFTGSTNHRNALESPILQ